MRILHTYIYIFYIWIVRRFHSYWSSKRLDMCCVWVCMLIICATLLEFKAHPAGMVCLFQDHFELRWLFWPRDNNCCKLLCPFVKLPLQLSDYLQLYRSLSPLPLPYCLFHSPAPLPNSLSVECPLMFSIIDRAQTQSCSPSLSPLQIENRIKNKFNHTALIQHWHRPATFRSIHVLTHTSVNLHTLSL